MLKSFTRRFRHQSCTSNQDFWPPKTAGTFFGGTTASPSHSASKAPRPAAWRRPVRFLRFQARNLSRPRRLVQFLDKWPGTVRVSEAGSKVGTNVPTLGIFGRSLGMVEDRPAKFENVQIWTRMAKFFGHFWTKICLRADFGHFEARSGHLASKFDILSNWPSGLPPLRLNGYSNRMTQNLVKNDQICHFNRLALDFGQNGQKSSISRSKGAPAPKGALGVESRRLSGAASVPGRHFRRTGDLSARAWQRKNLTDAWKGVGLGAFGAEWYSAAPVGAAIHKVWIIIWWFCEKIIASRPFFQNWQKWSKSVRNVQVKTAL